MADGINGGNADGEQRSGCQQEDKPDHNEAAFEYSGGKHRGQDSKKMWELQKNSEGFMVCRPYFEGGGRGETGAEKALFLA